MNQREKYLLFGLLGALAIALVLWPMFQAVAITPITERNSRIEHLQRDVDQRGIDEALAIEQQARLYYWTSISLPPNPVHAHLLYQEWLERLVTIVDLEKPKVTPVPTMTPNRIYSAAQVKVEGDGTFDQICRFLHLFQRADLLHRVVRVEKLESLEGNQGNPLMRMSLIAEGLSLAGAPDRRRLFQETELAKPLDAEDTTLVVASAEGFPSQGPFRIRVGREYMTVKSASGASWTVERGADVTTPRAHAERAVVEHAPVSREFADRTPEFYASLVKNSPFTIPGPPIEYRPRLEIRDQTLVRGNPLKLNLKVTGHNPSRGQPVYHLADEAPAGMELDAESGDFAWTVPDDLPAGRYETKVSVTQGGGVLVESPLRVTLREPNTPPRIEPLARQRVYLGQPWSVTVKASDNETPANRLRFSLGQGAPEGLSIDASTGVLTWTPPLTVEPGQVEVTVNVADDGDPQLTGTLRLPIEVKFDSAQFTFLDGIVGVGDEREAWIRDRPANERVIVHTGETFTIADVSAHVLEIGPDFVMLLIGDETWRLPVGGNLRAMEKQPTRPVSAGASGNGPNATNGGEGEESTPPVEAPRPDDEEVESDG